MSRALANTKLRSAAPVFLISDIAATVRWYQAILGFEADAVPRPHNFCILSRDDVVIMLQQLAGYRKPDHYRERGC